MASPMGAPRRAVPALLAALLLLAPVPAPASVPEALDGAAGKEITAAEAKKVAMLLAGPKFMGRGTGQKGNEDAAKWLAAELLSRGFEPGPFPDGGKDGKVGPEDFLQEFTANGQPGSGVAGDRKSTRLNSSH